MVIGFCFSNDFVGRKKKFNYFINKSIVVGNSFSLIIREDSSGCFGLFLFVRGVKEKIY